MLFYAEPEKCGYEVDPARACAQVNVGLLHAYLRTSFWTIEGLFTAVSSVNCS